MINIGLGLVESLIEITGLKIDSDFSNTQTFSLRVRVILGSLVLVILTAVHLTRILRTGLLKTRKELLGSRG